jgi:hypothetical protein
MFGPDVGLHDFMLRKSNLPFLNVLMDTVQVHRNRLLELEHTASASYRKESLIAHQQSVCVLYRLSAKRHSNRCTTGNRCRICHSGTATER